MAAIDPVGSAAREQRIWDLWDTGRLSIGKIAEVEYGVTNRGRLVRHHLSKRGVSADEIDARSRASRRSTYAKQRPLALDLRAQGLSYEMIERRLGIGRQTIWRWCNEEVPQR